ncbi:hypothetical protein GCM10008927_17050 [Amylibacter ulvae]|uniref:YjiS-like domain-containing protein n=1 Tax=Paramylibacter ulvae TaxID=1651968 RepID=A0ABQ3D0P9_9RHOB|nr:DUF1127 domain-containing protein [Amylibacter ulvae]GHA52264.1 hypothetical protein GCM10008927_17050 [Amylibacter ulvae]
MAFLTQTQTKPSLLNILADKIDGLKKSYAQYRVYARTVAELSELSTRDLNDLGIGRGQIRAIARDAAYGA